MMKTSQGDIMKILTGTHIYTNYCASTMHILDVKERECTKQTIITLTGKMGTG